MLEDTDRVVRLRNLPVTINVTQLSQGFVQLLNEEELVILRFGMLPADRIEILEKQLRDKFEELGSHPHDVWPLSLITETYSADDRVSTVEGEVREWNIQKLVSEAVHEISLGIYANGNLVV